MPEYQEQTDRCSAAALRFCRPDERAGNGRIWSAAAARGISYGTKDQILTIS